MPVSRTSVVIGLGIVLLIPTVVAAQESNDWAQGMFDSLSHDFGVVAKGSEVRHRFKITNSSPEDIHLASVTASCGCTTAKCDAPLLKRNAATFVEVSVDTNRFQRQKESTVTVSFDRPRMATVSVEVKAYIRPDIVVMPSSINFGAVSRGTKQERTLSIAYAGRPDWTIAKVVTNDKRVDARVVETHRTSGQVEYDLVVALKADVPIGTLRSEVIAISNEENRPRFPIAVEASIEDDFTVTPSILELGAVSPGAEVRKTIVLRGREPFTVKRVGCPSHPGAIRPAALDESASRVHVLSLTFIAPREIGDFSQKFVLLISSGMTLEFTECGTVERQHETAVAR